MLTKILGGSSTDPEHCVTDVSVVVDQFNSPANMSRTS